jgi:hypothetical protein
MRVRYPLLAAALLALAACGDEDPVTGITRPAFLRVVNASPATATVDAVVDGEVVASAVAFGTASDRCVTVPVEAGSVVLRAGGQVVATVPADFAYRKDYVVILTGHTASARAATIVEDRPMGDPDATEMVLRWVNATAATAQLHVTAPDDAPTSPIFFAEPGEVTPFAFVPSTSTRSRFYEGNVTPPPGPAFADVSIDAAQLPTSRVGTVILTGAVPGRTATGFAVKGCR